MMKIVSLLNEHLTFWLKTPPEKKQNIEDGFEASEFFCNNSEADEVLEFFVYSKVQSAKIISYYAIGCEI